MLRKQQKKVGKRRLNLGVQKQYKAHKSKNSINLTNVNDKQGKTG